MNERPQTPLAKRWVLVGGGHSHALVLRMLGMKPLKGVEIVLVSDVAEAPYSGMLPGHLAGFYTHEQAHIDLRRLCQWAGAVYIEASVTGIDLAKKRVLCADHPDLAFDVVSLNCGSVPDRLSVPGATQWAIPAKPVPDLLRAWHDFVSLAKTKKDAQAVIVGGGAGGVELALAMRRALGPHLPITLIHRGDTILEGHAAKARTHLINALTRRHIALKLGHTVVKVEATGVHLADGSFIPADKVFWTTQASPPLWVAASGLQVDECGFLAVHDTLQSVSHPMVFGAGDVATILGTPRPKSGVFAVRMAKPLLQSVRAYLDGKKTLPSYRAQSRFLSLIGTGDGNAVASRGEWAAAGRFWWWLKDKIDRRFMRRFTDLPGLTATTTHNPAQTTVATGLTPVLAELQKRSLMRCRGCAAKVGSEVLSRVMQRLREEYPTHFQEHPTTEIIAGLGQPDDAAAFTVPPGLALVQTIDYMPSLVSDPFLFGRLAALHSLSDLFAMRARPHSVLVNALLPFNASHLTEEHFYHLLSGVFTELRRWDVLLLGGHTAEAHELGLALVCNGLIDPAKIWRKSGLQPGQVIILTKPIGTGALFAADMRGAVRPAALREALDSMLTPNAAAAEIFVQHGATACTDVTGFGLVGHLTEMLRASHVRAQINLRDIPFLAGSLKCVRQGLVSSLQSQNQRAVSYIKNAADYCQAEAFPLLFDPQTSGGLIASLPAAHASDCLADLHQSGHPRAAVIGLIQPLSPKDHDEEIFITLA